MWPVLGIRDMLVRIGIRTLFSDSKNAKKLFFFLHLFILQLTRRHIIFSLKNLIFLLKFYVKIYFASIISVHSTPL